MPCGLRAGSAVPASGPDQCEDRLNRTPHTGLTWHEGLRWRASARPGWRRLTLIRDSGNARTSDQPTPRVPGTAGGCAAPSRRHRKNSLPTSADRGSGSSRSAQSQPGHLALTGSRPSTGRSARVQDQPASITILRLRRRLRRQPTGWPTERRVPHVRRSALVNSERHGRGPWRRPSVVLGDGLRAEIRLARRAGAEEADAYEFGHLGRGDSRDL